MFKNLVAFVVIFTFFLITPLSAKAEGAEIVQITEEGRTLCEGGNPDGGINILQAGFDQHGDPVLLYFIGRCHQVASRPCQAAEFLTRYLALVSDDQLINDRRTIEHDRDILAVGCADNSLPLVNPPPPPDPEDPEPTIFGSDPEPEPNPSRALRGWGIASLLLGSALTTAGIIQWGVAYQYWQENPNTPHPNATSSGVSPVAMGGDFSFAIGITALAVGVIMYLVEQTRYRRWQLRQSPDPPEVDSPESFDVAYRDDW
ncbi:MAG: hypothetical protein HQ538_00770 [Parcubacteria group bacterium]|nr:hypothetical protein [Parcubacteria group bacterium]